LDPEHRWPLIIVLALWTGFWCAATALLLFVGLSPQDIEGHPTLSEMWIELLCTVTASVIGLVPLTLTIRSHYRERTLQKTRGFPVQDAV
jgi:hypothetical protein